MSDPFKGTILEGAAFTYEYTLDQAVGDGALVEVFKNRWPQITGGKPLMATSAMHQEYSLAAIRDIWNEYVEWRKYVAPGLAEEDRMFVTHMNGRAIWVMEDGTAFTVLFPEDY